MCSAAPDLPRRVPGRRAIWLGVLALLAGLAVPSAGPAAQTGTQTGTQSGTQTGIAAPPVGRITEASGPVSQRVQDRGAWSAAPRGTQVRPGQWLRTGADSRVELDLGANRIGLDPGTVLRIDSPPPGAVVAATLEQGRAMLLLRSVQPGQTAVVNTPRGTVTLGRPGLYVIDAGSDSRPTTVGVTRGLAQVYGPGVSLMVAPGQTGVLGGADGRPAALRQGVAEGFLADDPSQPPLPAIVTPAMPPPLPAPLPRATVPGSAYLPYGEALPRDGEWERSPEYGTVWYPPVTPGWSPYVDPWTERWGYAPWYYGTWIEFGPRWGWVPPPRHHYYGAPRPGYDRLPRHGHPPPGVALPRRQPPIFGGSPPGRPPGGAPPQVVRPAPAQPPIFGGRSPTPLAPGAPPPMIRPAPAQPPIFGGRPPAPSAAPPAFSQSQPPIFGGRPQAAPMAAPAPRPAPAPAPARRCGVFGNPC